MNIFLEPAARLLDTIWNFHKCCHDTDPTVSNWKIFNKFFINATFSDILFVLNFNYYY